MITNGGNKAQSVLEYSLLLAAVIGVIVAVVIKPGGIQGKISSAYNETGNALNKTIANITNTVFK